NLVHQRNRNAVVPGNGGQHVKSQFAFVKIKRRRRDVQQDLSTRADQVLHRIDSVQLTVPEILVVPRVFANRERELLAVKGQQLLAIGGREVAHLVKHVVAGQQAFRLDGGDLSIAQQRRRVHHRLAGSRTGGSNQTADHGNALGRYGDRFC